VRDQRAIGSRRRNLVRRTPASHSRRRDIPLGERPRPFRQSCGKCLPDRHSGCKLSARPPGNIRRHRPDITARRGLARRDTYKFVWAICPAPEATTVLATVEARSEPDRVSFSRFPATTPACPGGAMFPWHSVGGCTRRGDWQRRQPRLNIAPRRQAAGWRGYGFGDAFLVLNIARRRQAPPWRRYLRWPDPSVPIVVGFDGVGSRSHSRNRTTCASSRESRPSRRSTGLT